MSRAVAVFSVVSENVVKYETSKRQLFRQLIEIKQSVEQSQPATTKLAK